MAKTLFLKNKSLLFFIFFTSLLYAQKTEIKVNLKEGTTVDVVKQAEKLFEVYYSYNDSLLLNKSLRFRGKVSLNDFHVMLENQNDIAVIAVNSKLFSLTNKMQSSKSIILEEVNVKGYLINSVERNAKKTLLKSFNSEILPGISDFDILRALQQLPGVKSPNQTASGLYVKGGAPDQNAILWNDIRMYHPGHLFGMISPINPEIVNTVSFYSNTIPTNFGGRVSSIIDMRTDSIGGKNRFKIGANMLYADFYHKLLSPNKKVGFQYSVRKSIAPLINTPSYKSYSQKVFQNTTFPLYDENNEFDFWDASFAFDWKIDAKNYLKFSTIYITNKMDYADVVRDSIFRNQQMKIKNFGASMQHNVFLTSKTQLQSTLHYSDYKFDYLRQTDNNEKYDSFFKNNKLLDSGFEMLMKYIPSSNMNYSIGYQLTNNWVKHLINSNNKDFGINISEKNNLFLTNNLNFNAQFRTYKQELNLGARITSNKNTAFLFEPRINVTHKFSDILQTVLSYEKRSQILQQVNENSAGDISLESFIWVLSDDKNLPILTSDQVNLGLLYNKNKFALEFDIYVKKTNGLTSFSEGVFFSENESSSAISKLSSGNSIVKGFDFSVQQEFYNWKFFSSYSYLSSKSKIEGINQDGYFKSNSNIPHSFNITTSYKLNSFYLSMGWFWNSGRPYSEIDENSNIISFNEKTLQDFHSLDISFLYNKKIGANLLCRTGITINNLYNHKIINNKAISRVYATFEDLATPRYVLTDYYSLGFTPNVFFKLYF